VAVLHRGGLLRLGRPADEVTAATLREVYGVDVSIHEVTLADGGRTRICVPWLARVAPTARDASV
jgi:ABC-type cobalamin/Fe3+-siderophores transport system ATPase subunit